MKIITISREYGACGRTIAKGVAEKLGIEVYDKDISRETAAQSGLDYDYIEAEAERISRTETILRRITPISYDEKDALFEMQRDIILNFASKGPCVIVGRCADAILEEAGYDPFKVFLHGDIIFRAIRVSELLSTKDPALISKAIQKTDHERATYTRRYTGKSWGDYRNYDLMLNVGTLGKEKCVDLIVSSVEGK